MGVMFEASCRSAVKRERMFEPLSPDITGLTFTTQVAGNESFRSTASNACQYNGGGGMAACDGNHDVLLASALGGPMQVRQQLG